LRDVAASSAVLSESREKPQLPSDENIPVGYRHAIRDRVQTLYFVLWSIAKGEKSTVSQSPFHWPSFLSNGVLTNVLLPDCVPSWSMIPSTVLQSDFELAREQTDVITQKWATQNLTHVVG